MMLGTPCAKNGDGQQGQDKLNILIVCDRGFEIPLLS